MSIRNGFQQIKSEMREQDLLKEEERMLNGGCCSAYGATKKRYSTRSATRQTDLMMKNVLMHANLEWREQRSAATLLLDPKNKNKMTRKRAGVVYTSWDSLMTRWSDLFRWWETDKDWDSFVMTAEEVCGRKLRKTKEGPKKEC